jgi:hypothetical protein
LSKSLSLSLSALRRPRQPQRSTRQPASRLQALPSTSSTISLLSLQAALLRPRQWQWRRCRRPGGGGAAALGGCGRAREALLLGGAGWLGVR